MKRSKSMSDISSSTWDLIKIGYLHHEYTDNRHRRVPDTAAGSSGLTVPQSPMDVPFQKGKEVMEAEVEKFKIKANHIPKLDIKGCTFPEPFNSTEVEKGLNHSPMYVQASKASPVPSPKHILEKPHVCIKQLLKISKPFEKRKSPVRYGITVPEPFSFHERDEERKQLHEKWIIEQLEKESKLASQFKAHSLPRPRKKRMQVTTVKWGPSSAPSENKENQFKFVAKSPVGLYNKPFKPILTPTQLRQNPFHLATEKRAVDRKIFDNMLKENLEEKERCRQQREKVMLEAEERAIAEMRVTLVHRPKPAPQIDNPFVPKECATLLTVPETPTFVRRLKHKDDAEMRVEPVTSPAPFVPKKSSIPLTVPETPTFVRRLKHKDDAEMRVEPVNSPAPFVPKKSSIPLTVPETPTFVRRLKKKMMLK